MYRSGSRCEHLSRVHRHSDLALIIILETFSLSGNLKALIVCRKRKGIIVDSFVVYMN